MSDETNAFIGSMLPETEEDRLLRRERQRAEKYKGYLIVAVIIIILLVLAKFGIFLFGGGDPNNPSWPGV